MKKILLISSPTIAAKILVKRTKHACNKNTRVGEAFMCDITILPKNEAKEHITSYDALILPPSLRYLLGKTEQINMPEGMPVAVIDSKMYGDLDGDGVLSLIEGLFV